MGPYRHFLRVFATKSRFSSFSILEDSGGNSPRNHGLKLAGRCATIGMRTERSPKADILHPHAFDSLNFCAILLNLVPVQPENVTPKFRHIPLTLFKKIQVSIIFCKTPLQDYLLVFSNLFRRKQKYTRLRSFSQRLET